MEEGSRTRLQKIVLLALAAMVLVFGALTFVSRLHRGVLFEDAILQVEETAGETVYSGKVRGEAVSVSVVREGETVTAVTYTVADRVHDVYRLEYPLAPVQTEHGPVDGVRITRNGHAVFEGGYDPGGLLGGWYDGSGQWAPDIQVTGSFGGETASAPGELTRDDVGNFAEGPALTARGSWALYFLMVFSSGLLALDAAFPLTMFHLRYMCDVRDPEPSDLYVFLQRVGWVVLPVLLLIGYILALRSLP